MFVSENKHAKRKQIVTTTTATTTSADDFVKQETYCATIGGDGSYQEKYVGNKTKS